MSCRDHMNRSIRVCSPDDTVSECAEVVRSQNIPMLCVLAPDQSLVGVLTRDAVLAASWLHRGAKVGDIMSTMLIYCEPEVSTEEARRLLARTGAPIILVAEGDHLLGWLSPHDLINIPPMAPVRTKPPLAPVRTKPTMAPVRAKPTMAPVPPMRTKSRAGRRRARPHDEREGEGG